MDFSSVLGLAVLKQQLFTKTFCHFDTGTQSFLVHKIQLIVSHSSRHAFKYLIIRECMRF